jgi:hypothetical protein
MRSITFLPLLLLLALPVVARADRNPDFDDDAKPILRQQPGLLEFVEANFKVKDTGTAQYPGDDTRRPQPPFMFQAKPRGEHGPYHLMLLIQPGPANHILNVVDMNHVHLNQPIPVETQPAPGPQSTPPPPVASSSAPSTPPAAIVPPPATQAPPPPQTPTADTPTGPIQSATTNQPAPATAPSLEPPPDPAPATH